MLLVVAVYLKLLVQDLPFRHPEFHEQRASRSLDDAPSGSGNLLDSLVTAWTGICSFVCATW